MNFSCVGGSANSEPANAQLPPDDSAYTAHAPHHSAQASQAATVTHAASPVPRRTAVLHGGRQHRIQFSQSPTDRPDTHPASRSSPLQRRPACHRCRKHLLV